ncbi:MAG TPA: hypothetical protein VF147_03045 [Vicinamibacterales bacterium]
MVETPRQRQIRAYEAQEADAHAASVRQRRREAKCALVGHRMRIVAEDRNGGGYVHECDRCGLIETLPF